MRTIHSTAIVDSKAEIGENVEIGPYCVIGAYVSIGNGTKLFNHVTIEGPTTVGRNNVIYPYCVIGADPQDLKFHGEPAPLTIGDRNRIREHVTIHRGTDVGGGLTRVGSDNLIMVAAHIAHDCIVGSHCVIANQVMLGGHAMVEDGVNIGGGAGIHHYCTIGTRSFVAGLCRVKKDVPPYVKVDGDPLSVRGINTIALARCNFSEEEIAALKDAYRRLYLHAGNGGVCTSGDVNGGRSGSARSAANGCARDPDGDDVAGNMFDNETPGATVIAASAARASESRGHDGESPLTMADRIEKLLGEFAQYPTVVALCQSLKRSACGIHGRSREVARVDDKFATRSL